MTVCAYVVSKKCGSRVSLCELSRPDLIDKAVLADLAENKPEDFCLDCNAVILAQYKPMQFN